jgi:hypothetical protein
MPFLIDGHNVIAALPDIDLEDQYDEAKLVLKLRSWSSRIRRKAIVVFDGGIPGGTSSSLSTANVKVVFAAFRRTNADRIIRARLKSLPDAPNWTVVSSDREILDEADSVGARSMSAQDFAEQIERPPSTKEKPDTISPNEIEAWLEVFGESEEEVADETTDAAADDAWDGPATSTPLKPAAPKPQKKRARRVTQDRTAPPPPSRRHTRSIGDQMGVEIAPTPEAPRGSEKPTDLSPEEVDAWLEIFHDDPDSEIPPPNLPKPKPKPTKRPVVDKSGDLSEDEVETWLDVFEAGGRSEATMPHPEAKPRRMSSKLAEQKSKQAPVQDGEDPELSQEDLELWHRLFGEEKS